MPRLSIVIPTYNGQKVLRDCLASVQRHRPADTEIIVVDDCSTDGTAAWLQATQPWVRPVRLESNHGFCGAINAGLRLAQAPVVETLNNDTVVTAHWAEPALQLFDDPSVGSVAPLVWLLGKDGLIDSAGDTYHMCGWARNRGHHRPMDQSLAEATEVFGASASAAFYRRAALLQVGLFPEHFKAYSDDVDLAFRLRWAGYRCLYTPHAQVYHRLHHTYQHKNPQTLRQLFLNEERVFWTNLPGALLARGFLPHLIDVACNAVGRWVANENLGPFFLGKLGVLREVGGILKQRQARHALAQSAAHPVHFPIETDWATVLHTVRKRLRGLKPLRFNAGPAAPPKPGREASAQNHVHDMAA